MTHYYELIRFIKFNVNISLAVKMLIFREIIINYYKRTILQVDSYEKYVLECEEKERAEMLDQIDDEKKNLEMSEKWKERRECLDMLKRELERVREGKDMSDWDALLDEELKKHELESKLLEEEEEKEDCKNDVNKEKSDNEKETKKDEIDIEPKKKK